MKRTRVKFCGFTQASDVQAAVGLGADALGFVFYEASPRYVSPTHVAELVRSVPAFISTVGLFVNASVEQINGVLAQVPLNTIQLHGDESWGFALKLQTQLGKPVIKAIRVNEQTDWAEISRHIDQIAGVLLDADAVGYGGAGHAFDWSVIPHKLYSKIILSGGLTAQSTAKAIHDISPYALDVSSGIEAGQKGIKDPAKMMAFLAAAQQADQERWR